MVIGVDAGAICEADERLKVGVYRVTAELLKQLALIDKVNAYRLYSYAPIPKALLSLFGNNMVNIALTPSVGYMKLRLPFHIKLHPPDVFLGLSQAVPVGTKHAIGFVYDLGFLHAPSEYGNTAGKLTHQTEEVVARSTHLVTISEATKQDIVNTYHIDAKRISVAHPGISDVFLAPGEEMHTKHPYILSVGLLKPGKHLSIAIRAFASFLERIKKPYDFVVIGGDTNLDPAIKKTIHELHLEKRVKLLGYVSDGEVARWYRGADALIALSTHEGFCLPAAESLACGCPVIYANQGALPEIVGSAGVAVTVENKETIVDAMMRLCSDTSLRNERRKKAFMQSKLYRWDLFAQKVFAVINDVSEESKK